MATDLTGVELKLRRAHRHVADLQQAIATVFDPSRYRFELNLDVQTQKHVLTAHDVPTVDPDWSPIVGDCLFNLRSALDHLAWQLVLLDGGTPGEETQFPVRPTPFNKTGDLIGPTIQPGISDPKILTALAEVQPYRGPVGEPIPYTQSPLWRLTKLNNIDKHRLLLVVVSIPDAGAMWWPLKAQETAPTPTVETKPLEDGSPVAWFDFLGNEPPLDFDPHPALTVVIRELTTPEIKMIPLMDVLSQLVWWVEAHIFGLRFRPLFP